MVVVLIAAFFCACKTQSPGDGRLYHRTDFYKSSVEASQKIEDRIVPAAGNVIDYLEALDSTENYDSYSLATEEKALFGEYLKMLPRNFQNIIAEKVIAIYFINNFMTAGMTNWAYDEDSNLYTVLFFNPDVLRQTVTDWVNYRDNSFFHDDNSGVIISAKCGGDYYALLSVLLHEASHIYDYYHRVTPYTEPVFNDGSVVTTCFVDGIWAGYNTPLAIYNFNHRDELNAYGFGYTLDRIRALDIYKDLKNTPFVSIYGSGTWAEDFAEAFTWAYLKEKFDVTYTVEISVNDEIMLTFSPLQNVHFQNRMRYLRELFKN
jgi:hypothetical protein